MQYISPNTQPQDTQASHHTHTTPCHHKICVCGERERERERERKRERERERERERDIIALVIVWPAS